MSFQKLLHGRVSLAWEIILAFFLGGAVSSVAQDPSDTIFFYVSSKGALTANQQTFYWYIVPFALYFSLFLLAWMLAKMRLASPMFLIWFYLALVLFSTAVSFTLPQSQSLFYDGIVGAGTVISIGIIMGLRSEIKGAKH